MDGTSSHHRHHRNQHGTPPSSGRMSGGRREQQLTGMYWPSLGGATARTRSWHRGGCAKGGWTLPMRLWLRGEWQPSSWLWPHVEASPGWCASAFSFSSFYPSLICFSLFCCDQHPEENDNWTRRSTGQAVNFMFGARSVQLFWSGFSTSLLLIDVTWKWRVDVFSSLIIFALWALV
jgi:hypothetical protein